jgi:aquaporin Z
VETAVVTEQIHAQQRLKGHPADPATPQPKASGWHLTDRACEFLGTALHLFLGFGAVAVLESPQSTLTSALPGWARLVLIGIAFGVLAAIVATSPIGRRSGAHLNPAVTLGFYLRGHTPARDLLGYVAAQVVGALVAAVGFVSAWQAWAPSIHGARTAPAAGLRVWGVIAIEAALTFGLLSVVFAMVSSARTARWTPTVVTGALAGLIWAGAAHTGASMNPARTLGPDIVTGTYPVLWAYFVGPLCGAALAAGAFTLLARERTTLTAKLFHDSEYPSVHATALPAKPHRGTNQQRPAPSLVSTAYPDDLTAFRNHGSGRESPAVSPSGGRMGAR